MYFIFLFPTFCCVFLERISRIYNDECKHTVDTLNEGIQTFFSSSLSLFNGCGKTDVKDDELVNAEIGFLNTQPEAGEFIIFGLCWSSKVR